MLFLMYLEVQKDVHEKILKSWKFFYVQFVCMCACVYMVCFTSWNIHVLCIPNLKQ